MSRKKIPELNQKGSLITFWDRGTERCLGFLFDARRARRV